VATPASPRDDSGFVKRHCRRRVLPPVVGILLVGESGSWRPQSSTPAFLRLRCIG
jgi:hypothetical protein